MAVETLMHNTEPLGALLGDASDIIFDNGGTYLESTDVEGALKEIDSAIPEIADNLTTDDSTKALSAKQGKVLNEKIDDVNSIEVIPATAVTGVTNNSIVYKKSDNELIISVDVTFSSVTTMWNNAFTVNIPNKQCTGVFGASNNGGVIQAYGDNTLTVRLQNVSANTVYRGQIIVPLLNL